MWPGVLLVAVVEHRGERGRLAGAGGADHQHQAALFHDQLGQDRRQRQRLQRRDFDRDVAEHRRDVPRWRKADRRKLPTPAHRNADVELVARAPVPASCSAARTSASSAMDVGAVQLLLVDRDSVAVDLDDGSAN